MSSWGKFLTSKLTVRSDTKIVHICSGAAVVLTVAGLKIIRLAWTELSRQYLVLIFTLFFFSFDYRHLSEGLPLDYFIIAILFFKVRTLVIALSPGFSRVFNVTH